ncbi:MAG: hypothetical protein B7X58_07155, partial [Marinobacter sp. 34-60-7]
MLMRLDQFVATCTALSRKDAKVAITRRRVRIDGIPCKEPRRQVSGSEAITLDQQLIALPVEVYLMLNKPEGILSATRDSSQPTVNDLLPTDIASRVHPAGRQCFVPRHAYFKLHEGEEPPSGGAEGHPAADLRPVFLVAVPEGRTDEGALVL